MYLCSCKGLTDSDIREIARKLALSGMASVESLLQVLQLHDDDACGLCGEAPEQFIDVAVAEWALLRVEYQDSRLDQ